MITVKKTLPIGVEHGGKVHRELEVRPRLVKDLVKASDSDLVISSKNAYEVCCLAEQILKIGDIPKAEITGEFLMEMYDDDFNVISDAAEEVRKKVASFRREKGADKEAGPGNAEAGLSQ